MTSNPFLERNAIKNLQRYLRQLSRFDADIPPLPISGLWDPDTRDALIAFQKKNGLTPSGVADAITWNLLYEQYLASIEEKTEPLRMPIYPRLPERSSLKLGDVGFAVTAVQYMLDELTLAYDGLEGVTQNGIYDAKTAASVREFQKRNLLPESGEVDKRTWDALVRSYEQIANDIMQ
ncbi:MAG: peptidoglycan-binding protein [Clostridia bacterium]|nr:peptidoglycan-binding protein [Clostridia bacterium]